MLVKQTLFEDAIGLKESPSPGTMKTIIVLPSQAEVLLRLYLLVIY